MNAKFSETLRKLREEKGLSQKQLGKQMFVNHSTIARWENGTRLPDAVMISRLAKCLGVDTNTLFLLAAVGLLAGCARGVFPCRPFPGKSMKSPGI